MSVSSDGVRRLDMTKAINRCVGRAAVVAVRPPLRPAAGTAARRERSVQGDRRTLAGRDKLDRSAARGTPEPRVELIVGGGRIVMERR
jgi:hypothetical protein